MPNTERLTRTRRISAPLVDAIADVSAHEDRLGILSQVQAHLGFEDDAMREALVTELCELRLKNRAMREGVEKLEEVQKEQREMIDMLTAPAHHPAVFQCLVEVGEATLAVVSSGATYRAVGLLPEMDPSDLRRGDQVMLAEQMNVILEKTPPVCVQGDEIADFKRVLPTGQLVLQRRDEQIVVNAAGSLDTGSLEVDDQVTYDPALKMAFARIPRVPVTGKFVRELPDTTWEDIGGLQVTKKKLHDAVSLIRENVLLSTEYGLRPIRGITLHGAPGNGKTLCVQALTREMGVSRVMSLNPGEIANKWYGESERIVREIFAELRWTADRMADGMTGLMLEELDAFCATRGRLGGRIDDKIVGALLAELDGIRSRGNVLIVGTTNRIDVLDPAILRPGRLGDRVIEVTRPDRAGTREILGIHMADIQRYAGVAEGDADGSSAVRDAIIESVVDRVFAPNGLGPVARLRLQDGSAREIRPRDLISGAGLAKIRAEASEAACLRHIEGGARGVGLEDFLCALDEEMRRLVHTLTPGNCNSYLDDLPQDNAVTAVDPLLERTSRTYGIMRTA